MLGQNMQDFHAQISKVTHNWEYTDQKIFHELDFYFFSYHVSLYVSSIVSSRTGATFCGHSQHIRCRQLHYVCADPETQDQTVWEKCGRKCSNMYFKTFNILSFLHYFVSLQDLRRTFAILISFFFLFTPSCSVMDSVCWRSRDSSFLHLGSTLTTLKVNGVPLVT